MDGADIEFVNNEETDTFKVILYRKTIQLVEESRNNYQSSQKRSQKNEESSQKSGQKTQGSGQKNVSLILRSIKQNPKISIKKLSEIMDISQSAIQNLNT